MNAQSDPPAVRWSPDGDGSLYVYVAHRRCWQHVSLYDGMSLGDPGKLPSGTEQLFCLPDVRHIVNSYRHELLVRDHAVPGNVHEDATEALFAEVQDAEEYPVIRADERYKQEQAGR